MYTIIIYFNKSSNKLFHDHILDVVEYYCTEKMFYIYCNDGYSVYYSLDEISKIEVHKNKGEET